MTGAISSALSACTLHFTTGAAMATRSWPRMGSRRRSRVSCCPAVTTMGELVLSAPKIMPMALPRPGATCRFTTPARPAGLGVVARSPDGDALVQRQHVVDRRVAGEAVDQRALGGAGVAEQVPDPVRQQALHEDVTPVHVSSLSLG